MEKESDYQLTSRQKSIAIVLVILYVVGTLGFIFNIYPQFERLTPVNLSISLILTLFCHPKWDWKIVLFCLLCPIIGFIVEMKGVETGLIFGKYQYDYALGYKYRDTPLSIGINWLLISYCSGVLVSFATDEHRHWAIKALIAAALMVSLDVLIEPIAMKTGMWHWENDTVPFQNYVGWFITAFVIQSLFFILNKTVKNKVAVILLVLQFLFFWILSFKY